MGPMRWLTMTRQRSEWLLLVMFLSITSSEVGAYRALEVGCGLLASPESALASPLFT